MCDLKKGSVYDGQKDNTPSGLIKHLRFVISDFIYDDIMNAECAFVVNMTSAHDLPTQDNSCILYEADHPSIEHKSYISYQNAQRLEKSYILSKIESGEFVLKEEMSPELLKKIQEGANISDDTPKFIEMYKGAF